MIQLVESGGPPFKVMGPLAALMDSQYGALFIYLFGHEEIFMKKKKHPADTKIRQNQPIKTT